MHRSFWPLGSAGLPIILGEEPGVGVKPDTNPDTGTA